MTTIAVTATEVAADGQRMWGCEIVNLTTEKIHVQDGMIYAFSGTFPLFHPMIEWHLAGADPKELPTGVDYKENGWTLVVIDDGGLFKYTSSCPYPEELEPPIAFGAGGDYATGAMLHGATAKEAVEIVARLCNHTGGQIKVVDIAKVTGFTLRRTHLREAAE